MPDQRIQIIIEALNKTDKEFAALKGQFKGLSEQVKENSGNWQKLSADGETFRLKAGEIERSLQSLFGAFLLYRGISFLKSSIDEAEKAQNSIRGLGAVARYNGVEIGAAMQAAAKLAEDGLVDITDVSKALQNLLQRGFSLDEAISMLARLKDSAAFNRQASLSMSAAVVSATEGLKNENSILVDNAGVTKNVSIMWKEYAAEIGKTVNDLTLAEKRQAEYNGIMKETEAQLGNAKLATEGLTGAKAKLNVETQKLQRSLGQTLAPAFLEIAKAANWTLKNAIIPFIGGIEILSAKVAAFSEKRRARQEIMGYEGAIALAERQGDKNKAAEYRAKLQQSQAVLAAANKNLDDQIADIMGKWSGELALPVLGKDSGKRNNKGVGTGGEDTTTNNLKKRWADTSRDLDATIAGEGLSDFEIKLIQIQKTAEKLTAEFGKIPGAKAKISLAATADEDKAAVEAAKKDFDDYLDKLNAVRRIKKEVPEEQKKAAQERAAVREAEIQNQLAELDVAEKLQGADKETNYRQRIELLESLKASQEEFLGQIDRLKDPTGWNTQEAKIISTRKSILELQAALNNRTWTGGAILALDEIADRAKNIGQMIGDAVRRMFDDMTEALTGFTMTGKFRFEDFANSVIRDMARIYYQQQITGPLAQAGSSWLGSLLGNSGPGKDYQIGEVGSPYTASEANYIQTGAWHGGGMGYEPTFYRIIPNVNLPRYHRGLGPGERMSVTTDAEMVLTPGQQRRMWDLARESGAAALEVAARRDMRAAGEVIVNLTINAIDSQSVSQRLAQHQKEIVGMIQQAYNRRGQKGPMG